MFNHSPFVLKNMSSIFMGGNRLASLPPAIFNSFNPKLKLHVILREQMTDNPHDECSTSYDCDCCNDRPFAQWMRQHNTTTAGKSIGCGWNPLFVYEPNPFNSSPVFGGYNTDSSELREHRSTDSTCKFVGSALTCFFI